MFFYCFGGYAIIKNGLKTLEYLSMLFEKTKTDEKNILNNTRKAINIIFVFLMISLLYYELFNSSLFSVLCVLLGIITFLMSLPKITRLIKESNTHPIGKEIIVLALKVIALIISGYVVYWIYCVMILGR